MKFSRIFRVPVVVSVIFVLALLFGLPLVWIMGLKLKLRQAQTQAMSERQSLQAAHIPLNPQDLRRNPPVAEANNAAPLYREISRRFQAKKFQLEPLEKNALKLISTTSGTISAAQIADARKLLALAQPETPLIEQASQKPECDFERPYEQGADTEFPELRDMRRAVRLLAIKAEMLDQAGKSQESLQQITMGAKIAQHSGQEPNQIAFLVQIALESIADKEWHKLVNRHAKDGQFLERAAKVSASFGALPDLKYALGGELVMGTVMIEQIRNRRMNYKAIDVSPEDFERYMPGSERCHL